MDATETFPYAETSAAAFSSSTSLDGIRFRLEQLSLRTILLVLVILVLLILVLITVFRRMARKKRRADVYKRQNDTFHTEQQPQPGGETAGHSRSQQILIL